MPYVVPSSVLVTGAGGNLGRKLVEALAATPWCRRIVGLDLAADPGAVLGRGRSSKLTPIAGRSRRSRRALGRRFRAASTPWSISRPRTRTSMRPGMQASNSFDMTVNVALAAMRHGVRRVVFASSNHVMGGYKDAPLADTLRPGALTTALCHRRPERAGTTERRSRIRPPMRPQS